MSDLTAQVTAVQNALQTADAVALAVPSAPSGTDLHTARAAVGTALDSADTALTTAATDLTTAQTALTALTAPTPTA